MTIEYNITPTVTAVGQMQISGNVTPELWYKNIRRRGGEKRPTDKAYLEAISILAEIVYWYRPTLVRDEATGHLVRVTKKFAGDFLQRSYDALADKFGVSKDEARDAIVYLEKMGLVKRHFRTIDAVTDGGKMRLNNVLFIELIPDRLQEVTYNELACPPSTLPSGRGVTSEDEESTPCDGGTNTKTTETTTTTPAPAPENLVAPQPPPLTEESMAMLGLTTPDKWFGATRNWRAIGVDANRIKVADAGMTLAQQTELVNTLADIYGTRALIDQGQDDSELLRLQGLVLILWGMHEKYRTVDGLRALHDVWKQTHANWAFPAGKQFVNFASQCLQESGEKKANDNPTRQQATTRRPATNSGIDYTELAREKQRQLQASLPLSSGMAGTIDF